MQEKILLYKKINIFLKWFTLVTLLVAIVCTRMFTSPGIENSLIASLRLMILTALFVAPIAYITSREDILSVASSNESGEARTTLMICLVVYFFSFRLWLINFTYMFLVQNFINDNSLAFVIIFLLLPACGYYHVKYAIYNKLEEIIPDSPREAGSVNSNIDMNIKTDTKPEERPHIPDLPSSPPFNENLLMIMREIEDESLQEQIKLIVETISLIYEFDSKQNNDNTARIKLLNIYSKELFNLLVKYDEIENSRINTKEAIGLLKKIHGITEDMGKVFINILGEISKNTIYTESSRIDALRAEMKLKGLLE